MAGRLPNTGLLFTFKLKIMPLILPKPKDQSGSYRPKPVLSLTADDIIELVDAVLENEHPALTADISRLKDIEGGKGLIREIKDAPAYLLVNHVRYTCKEWPHLKENARRTIEEGMKIHPGRHVHVEITKNKVYIAI